MQNKNKIPRHFQASLNTARIESRNRYRPKLVELVEMARPPTTTERNSHSVGIIQESSVRFECHGKLIIRSLWTPIESVREEDYWPTFRWVSG